MNTGSLYGRVAAAFAVILLLFGIALGLLGYSAAKTHQQVILQQVSKSLAQRLATAADQADADDRSRALSTALAQVTTINPNVEAYLLDPNGRVLGHWPEDATPLVQDSVALAPIQSFLADARLPISGDNPRDPARPEVFSAAAIEHDGQVQGYVYLVLLSDMYHAMVNEAWSGYVLDTVSGLALVALLLALGAGLVVFFRVTRRLQRLTREVDAYRLRNLDADAAPEPRGDEISHLHHAFTQMRERLDQQIAEARRQDDFRRELVANVSHDLRTPLTSMLGYLETLVRMDRDLSEEQRRDYLEVAVRQSRKVTRLAQQLFELARLEFEETLPQPELFSLDELANDIAQKFALTAEEKRVRLRLDTGAGTDFVHGDIGMIERVISNLVDNAIRHTPDGGEITLTARRIAQGIELKVADTGQGIAEEHLPGLFERDSALRIMAYKRGGGLGLLIAKRILNLHGTSIHAASEVGRGTTVSFVLPVAEAA